MTEPIAGVPIFVCKLREVAAGDAGAVAGLASRLAWAAQFRVSLTWFECAHQPRCQPLAESEKLFIARLHPLFLNLFASQPVV